MTRGIVTEELVDPLVTWKTRINWFGSAQISAALTDLLSGRPVGSRDGELEISYQPRSSTPPTIVLSIRVPDAPYVADLVLRPLEDGEAKGMVEKPAEPCPDRWREVQDQTTRWQLFTAWPIP